MFRPFLLPMAKNANMVVLLTGGSSGIGAAAARMLAQAGMTVYSASRHPAGAETFPSGGKIVPAVLDVNDAAATERLVDQIVLAEGSLDAVVCNAGNGMAGSAEDTSEQEYRYQFETTFFGAVKTVKAALPVMRRQGHGRIITVSSVAGFAPIPYQSFYSAAKSALLSWTEAVRSEVRRFGIQTCVILPGDVRTGFTAARCIAAAAESGDSAYYATMHHSIATMARDEQNGMSPQVIARVIIRQLRRPRMRASVTPGVLYKGIRFLIRVLPDTPVMRIIEYLYK